MIQKPVMLLILDGWGYRRPITDDNAIEKGNTPNWHNLIENYPNCLIETSGLAVGLPDGQMGNSEVGHMNLGAGRVVMQDLPRIDQAVADGTIAENQVLLELERVLKANTKKGGTAAVFIEAIGPESGTRPVDYHFPKGISVEERKRGFSDRIIEEFMILANETVAETFSAKNIPFVYRVHDKPSEEKTLSFMQFIKDMGLANRIPSENPTPKDYAKLLDSVKDSPKYQIVNEILLRSLQKAVYHTENKGHFGLASDNYCHFTSPIRRYSDLAIHRIIKSVLDGPCYLELTYP